MDISRYELKRDQQDYTLLVYVDSNMTEFAMELGSSPKQKKELNTQIRDLIKEKFPHVPIKAAKVIAGSMLVTTLYLGITAPNVGAQTTSGETQTTNKYDVYTVKAGDTLNAIAKRYNVAVDSLKTVNGLTSDMIFVGQQLKLPFFTYTVSSGDTLYSIAKRYNVTVDQIRSYNQLTTDMLMIGQTLRIPQLQPPAPSTATQPVEDTITQPTEPSTTQPVEETTTQPAPETTTYTVVAGDTLYNLSIRFNTTVDQIKSLNNLTTNTLNIGQVLKIPRAAPVPEPTNPEPEQPTPTDPVTVPDTTQTYTVVAGDTLYTISKRFNTTVSTIQAANNLTTTSIFVGQQLMIPTEAQPTVEPQPPADTTAPGSPVLAPIQTVTTVNQSRLDVSGTTEANALVIVTITDNATPLTTQVKADANGAFQITQDVSTLNDGTLSITATATDQAGNKSTTTTQSVKKDTKTDAPTLINTEVINSQSTLAYPIKGTAEPGAKVKITFSDGTNSTIQTELIANEKGEFSTFLNLSTLRDGTITVTSKAIDSRGNESGTTKLTLTKDTTVETPTLQQLQDISSQNAAGYTVVGTAEPNTTITIRATDGVNPAVQKNITTGANGEWNSTLDLSSLNDGSITITTIGTDTFKNTSTPAQVTVIKDTHTAEPVLDTRQQVTNKNANSYTLFGMADPGSTVQLVISDGVNPEITLGATANDSGEFRTNVDLRTLNDGEISVMATAIDEHGNKSGTEQTTITKETAIAAPVITSTDIINSQNVTNYSVFGQAQPGATVDITISDGVNPDIITSTTANANGEFNVNVDVSALVDTDLTISAFQTSAAGITSNVSNTSVGKDTQSPAAPIFHNNHFINNQNQTSYSLLGNAERNTELQIRIFNVSGQELKVNGTTNENGEYTIPVDLSTFTDGDLSFEITQIDQAGNVSPAVTKTLIKDTVGPTTVKLQSPLPLYSGNVFTYPITGTAEPNTSLEITVSDGVGTITKTVQTDLEGQFEEIFDVSTLKDGQLTVSFRATDNAGNVGEPAPISIEKDTDAPVGIVATSPPYVNRENQNNYIIGGSSVEEGATVDMVVSDGTTTITKTAQVINGDFTANLDLSTLADGPLTVEIRQTDRAGNRSVAEATTIEKDTVVENAIATKNGFRYENLQYIYTLIGTAEANAEIDVSLFDESQNVLVTRVAQSDKNGYYSVDVFIDDISKVNSVNVTQTDQAGNTSEVTNVSLSTYTVSTGDSLYSIAKRYNTTADSLMTLNNLSSDVIEPNQQLRLPVTASEVVNLGYMYFGNTKEYVNTVNSTDHAVNLVSPSYFDINPDGTLKLTYQVDPSFIETMHRQGIRVVPFLSNHWNRDVGRAMLQNRELAAQQIADAIARYNLDGVNVDIENVTDADRDAYTEFVRLLRTKIPPTKEVSVAVAANPNGWNTGWHGSYDYTNLAKYADYLMIMSYDESYPGGDPGSIASYSWVEKSVQYALSQDVPPDKVVLGIAHFGRYWIEGQSYGGYGISNTQVETLIQRYNGTVVFDEISKTPKATVTIKEGDPVTFVSGQALSSGTYTIWFENDESIRYKLGLVSKYSIRGVGNWSLGQENRSVWSSYTTTLPNTVPVLSPVYTEVQTFKTYTVVSGDTLWAVANRNNTTVSAIKEASGITSDALYVGQVLKIPTESENTVQTGGTEGTAAPTETAPVVDTAPTSEPVPTEGTAPTSEPVPTEGTAPTSEPVPTEGTAPTSEPVPTEGTAPTSEPVPTEGTAPTSEPVPTEGTAPTSKPVPTEDTAPTTEPVPTEDTAPTTEPVPTEDTAPTSEPVPTEGTAPTSEPVPTEDTAPTTEPVPTQGATAPTYYTNYTVVAGDSLSAIAERNNTTVTAIKSANNLTTDTIYIGQVLKVPTNVVAYKVVSGDTLSRIAGRYNTTVTSIKTANNLTSDMIYVGQTLKIPVS